MLIAGRNEQLKVFDPKDAHETAQGWALHATRRRKIHDLTSRHLDRLRYSLGTVATVFAAVTGTSAFAAWQTTSKSIAAGVVTAVLGIGAAVLGSVTTFLDFGGRAEAHRRAAAQYKDVMRAFEESSGSSHADDQLLATLRTLLFDADRAAPTVPLKRAELVEREPFAFVATAEELPPS